MPKEEDTCRVRQLSLKLFAVSILKLSTHALFTTAQPPLSLYQELLLLKALCAPLDLSSNDARRRISLMVTSVTLLHSCIPFSGMPTGKTNYCSPSLGQNLIRAEYIIIWGYCRLVRVLIANNAAALSAAFLSQDLPG